MKMKIVLIAGLIWLSGCAITPQLPNLTPPKPPKTTYVQEEIRTQVPVMLIDSNGAKWAASKTEQHIITKLNTENGKQGLFARIGSFFGGLGFWFIVILVICFILAPTGTLMFIWGQKTRFQNAFKETVTAIKNSKAVDAHAPLHDALKSEQSSDTKKLVGEIKADL